MPDTIVMTLILLVGLSVGAAIVTAWCLQGLSRLVRTLGMMTVVIGVTGAYGLLGRPHLAAVLIGDHRTAEFRERQELHHLTERLELRLAQTPDDVEGWLTLARSFTLQQRHEDAIDVYTTLVQLLPDRAELYLYWAENMILHDQGRVSHAADVVLQKIPATSPYFRRAQTYRQQVGQQRTAS